MRRGHIPPSLFAWDDAKKVLTIGERQGSFTGMLKERKFNIVWVSKPTAQGWAPLKSMTKS